MNLRQLVEQLIEDGSLYEVMNDPLAQFGPPESPYLGAELMPEIDQQENAYIEEGIRYRTVIANDATRYSPVQKKRGILVGSFQVILGESDIGSEFTGQDYDTLMRILRRLQPGTRPSMEQIRNLIQWVELTLSQPLRMKNEKQRWEAICNAQVVRAGHGNYREVVNFPNPSGHRINIAGAWSDDTYDPLPDILALAAFLRGKGYNINRMFAGTPVETILLSNAKMRANVGVLSVQAGAVFGIPQVLDRDSLNAIFKRNRLPELEIYDGQYRTQTGSGYYLPRASLVMVCTTGRDISVIGTDSIPVPLPNTLGYTGIGRPTGQEAPGRALNIETHTTKPPRAEGEGWQTTGPVILEPEAIGVLNTIH